jgi:hypothetical protein
MSPSHARDMNHQTRKGTALPSSVRLQMLFTLNWERRETYESNRSARRPGAGLSSVIVRTICLESMHGSPALRPRRFSTPGCSAGLTALLLLARGSGAHCYLGFDAGAPKAAGG